MKSIRSLKPNVTREQALRHFTAGALNQAADVVRGRVRSIAELYIPYRVFQVKVISGSREETHIFALETVRGVLDLYQFLSIPSDLDLIALETRNVLPAVLSASEAEERVISKVRRIIFTRGFFKLRDLRIEATALPSDVCVPYWVCFRGAGNRVHLAVLDAVRRKPEGARVRQLVEDWLRSDAGGVAATGPTGFQVLS
jgi:hypothetical protein